MLDMVFDRKSGLCLITAEVKFPVICTKCASTSNYKLDIPMPSITPTTYCRILSYLDSSGICLENLTDSSIKSDTKSKYMLGTSYTHDMKPCL